MKRLYICAAMLIALMLPHYGSASEGITNKTKYTLIASVSYRDEQAMTTHYEVMYPQSIQKLSPGQSWKPESYAGAFIADVVVSIESVPSSLVHRETPSGCQLDIVSDTPGVLRLVERPCKHEYLSSAGASIESIPSSRVYITRPK